MPYLAFLFALCGALLLGMAAFVLSRNPASPLHRAFARTCLALLAWLGTLSLYDRIADPTVLLVLGRLNFASALAAVLLAYLFVRRLVGGRERHLPLLLGETALLCVLTLLTPLIDRAEYVAPGGHGTAFGPLFPLYLLHVAGYLAAALYLAFSSGRRASRRLRGQLWVIGTGIAATASVSLVCAVLLPYAFHVFAYQDFGPLSTILSLGAVAYAVTVHRLFDLRLAIKRTVVFALLLAFVLAAYSALVLFLSQALPVGSASGGRDLLTVLAILLIAFGFDPLRRFLEERTDRFLFRKEYAQQEVVRELARALAGITALDGALRAVLTATASALRVQRIAIVAFEPGEEGRLAVKRLLQQGFDRPARLLCKELDLLALRLQERRRPLDMKVWMRALAQGSDNADHSNTEALTVHTVLSKWRSLGVELAVPILQGERLAACLLLGEKRSGEEYMGEDFDLLEDIGLQALSALQKAALFESDQTKSEFVSIAAHELLTPITAVNWYLSMILDDHMGEVDAQAEEYLGKARITLKRLTELVKDLLSVSRLEGGRMSVTPQEVDIVSLIREVVDQLLPVATGKKLRLAFEQPEGALPAVWADPGRTTEVLVNLVGNAIKYTPAGSVTVRAALEPPVEAHGEPASVRIEVSDTGMGMSEEAQKRLFQRFYRTEEAQASGIQGTGLGLYITKSMVEKMGGTIGVESAVGKGSAFLVTLPVRQSGQVERPDAAHAA